MHINAVRGNFLFKEWDNNGWKKFDKQIQQLKENGYIKIDQEHDHLNYYEYYHKEGEQEVVTVTMMYI